VRRGSIFELMNELDAKVKCTWGGEGEISKGDRSQGGKKAASGGKIGKKTSDAGLNIRKQGVASNGKCQELGKPGRSS